MCVKQADKISKNNQHIYSQIKDYSDFYHMVDYSERFTLDSPATDIMICGFDNMEARKMFFDVWSAHVAECTPEQRRKCLFIAKSI